MVVLVWGEKKNAPCKDMVSKCIEIVSRPGLVERRDRMMCAVVVSTQGKDIAINMHRL